MRDLLEANLQALRALLVEHRQMIHAGLGAVDAEHVHLRDALLAIGSRQAPWVHAMEETRALLFVALRELIIGEDEAELSMTALPQAR